MVSAKLPLAFLEPFVNGPLRQNLEAGIVILGILAFVGISIWGMVCLNRHLKRKAAERTREIQAALGSGFTWTDATPELILQKIRLTSRTLRSRRVKFLTNRFTGGTHNGRSLQVMEGGYQVNTGKTVVTVWQTIALVGTPDCYLPEFTISPRGFFSRMGLGRGLCFPDHPHFTRLFKVTCEDEAAARLFMRPALIEALERFPKLTVEGKGSGVLFFRAKKLLRPEEFPPFIHDMRMLAAHLPQVFGEQPPIPVPQEFIPRNFRS